jgi:hypothetical protein
MKIVDCRDNVADQICKCPLCRRRASNDDIIVTISEMVPGTQAHGFPQAPPDAVALNRSAELAGDGETNPRRAFIFPAAQLNDRPMRGSRSTARRSQEILPAEETLHLFDPVAPNEVPRSERSSRLGRKAPATHRASPLQHFASSLRGHARAKAVTSLSDKLARLVGAFHEGSPY